MNTTISLPAPRTVSYGEDPSQLADLHLPSGDAAGLPVVVVVHGGFWGSSYGRDLGTPLAADLAARGVAAWNIEYRRIGNGGGWPATFTDTAAAIDALAEAGDGRLDLTRVVAVGHSAGGHLAAWAAGRATLPPGVPGAAPAVVLRGVVAQAGVLDLVAAAYAGLGSGAAQRLLGGSPEEHPDRYALASPYARLPIAVPLVAVHGTADVEVPVEQSRSYVAKARAAGGDARLVELVAVDHFALIDAANSAWSACRDEALRLLGG